MGFISLTVAKSIDQVPLLAFAWNESYATSHDIMPHHLDFP